MDKQQAIIQMFDDISPTYDRLNRILSFGIDRRWRKKGCEAALNAFASAPNALIDAATGTGDLILCWRKAAKKFGVAIDQIIGVDPSQNMLNIAASKIKDATFIKSEAGAIPLEDNFADLLSISYGIRNVVKIDKAIGEFYRLLKNGGVLLILEFMSHKRKSVFDRLVSFYLGSVLPAIGRLISKDSRAYTYLPQSIESFLSAEELEEKLKNAGFKIIQIKDETFKISTRFIAQKPQ
ncbi:MAG: bifunctional demethylmenaquinone methyltransferase/2-methoxy-6-polyprenyl-1,4-benzoquinol methylase UbiE [Helicobacteraceae bacterium]|jgi:demethylmenaquinone methyltransferase/2-methoxy-6-polyprenyl-1,4-benzoquinol methylase|nr:bifunctional demethylmenaquinone methyltransferase/2-methoxy-6-polyprenyl-1,4-benzoquinol methylase UbiE [Helicobacteraceae bacterium]